MFHIHKIESKKKILQGNRSNQLNIRSGSVTSENLDPVLCKVLGFGKKRGKLAFFSFIYLSLIVVTVKVDLILQGSMNSLSIFVIILLV